MKISKILAASALAFACAASAQATQTVIRIGGSSAYRGGVVAAVETMLNSGYTVSYSNDGSSETGANACNITGTLKSATKTSKLAANASVLIKCSWTGSAGGLDNVANSTVSTTRLFLPDSSPTGAVAPSTITASEAPDIAFSDVYKDNPGVTFVNNLGNLKEVTAGVVGVIPFKWVAGGDAVASGQLTNSTSITPQIVGALFSAGVVDLSVFTGVQADEASLVTATGRDAYSGTRITALTEPDYGAAVTISQSVLSSDGSTIWSSGTTGLQVITAPGNSSLNGHTFVDGMTGFASGGTLAKALRLTPSGNTMVTYLSKGDAATAIAATGGTNAAGLQCVELPYNGVLYGTNDDLVRLGKYTFWSYEHCFYRTADSSNYKGDFAESLATAILGVAAPSNTIKLSTMRCSRGKDGGTVTPLY